MKFIIALSLLALFGCATAPAHDELDLNDPQNRSDSQHTVDMFSCGYNNGVPYKFVKIYLACMNLKGYKRPQVEASK
jgi:hypothetical protein